MQKGGCNHDDQLSNGRPIEEVCYNRLLQKKIHSLRNANATKSTMATLWITAANFGMTITIERE